MKNFRKVLALVLVVATLFSFAAMASAAGYKDADKVSYKEAVDVLSALKILEGYPEDGTFRPTNSITREEMAKMIATLANAGDDVSKLYATACEFADVAKDRWSASYVAYCNKTGIVAGRSATTFDPLGKVTGLETAKMLLVTLGFDAKVQGYVGADWKINVLRDAKNFGLLDNFSANYNPDAAITREEAANMMLNTLKANVVVGVLSENVVKITNALYVSKYNNGTVTLPDAQKLGWNVMYKNVIVANHTLFEGLYGGKLTQSTNGRDCFGRPGSAWVWTDEKGEEHTFGGYASNAVWSSHDTTAKETKSKVEAYKNANEVKFFHNGAEANYSTMDSYVFGKGVQVELHATPVDVKVGDKLVQKYNLTVVMIDTFVGTVDELNTVKDEVTIKELNNNSGVATITGKNTYGFKHEDEGTIVLYWLCNKDHQGAYDLHDVKVANPTAITLHAYWNELGKFDDYNDKAYEFAATKYMQNNYMFEQKDLGNDFNVYTDEFGYVKYVAPITADAKVAVLANKTAIGENAVTRPDGSTEWTYSGKFVEFQTGAKIGDKTAIDMAMFEKDKNADHDVLVQYTADKDGKRTLVKTAAEATGSNLVLNAKSGLIDNFNAAAGTNKTQYLLRVYNYTTGTYEYKYFDGKAAIDNDYKLEHMQYFTTSYNPHDKDGKFLSFVYAEAKYAKATALAFLTNFYTTENYISKEGNVKQTYYLYNAFVDGKEALVAFETKFDTNDVYKAWVADYQLIEAKSHDGLPVYMATGVQKDAGAYDFIINDGTLLFKDKDGNTVFANVAPDAKIIVFTEVEGKISAQEVEQNRLVDYIGAHQWVRQYAYMDDVKNVSVLYLFVSDK